MIIIRLDRVIADRKISLSELAQIVGIDHSNLSRLKSSKVKAVKLSTLDALCKALKCTPGDILEFIEDDELSSPEYEYFKWD